MRYLRLYILFIIFLPLQNFAQERHPKNAVLVSRVPFRVFSGGVMVVKANLENIKDSLNFILDTGSGGISLDSATCAEYSIPTIISDTTITGIGGKRKVNFAFDKTLRFSNLDVGHLNFHINNYEVLSSVYGEHIDGIIGYSFFSRYIVKLDFDSMWMDVYTQGKFNYPKNGHTLHPLFTSIPALNLDIRDSRKTNNHFYFDTGAGMCFLMSERYIKDSAILLSKRKPVVTQAEGMLGRLTMRQTIIREVKVGPYHFRRVPTFIYEDTYNVTSYPFAGGLIGIELLHRFNITLNYAERIIHISPNSHFDEPFDYSYTGFGLYFLEGKVIIGEIVKGSPAYKAGLLEGDEIIGINNNLSKNIQTYKNMLQSAGQEFKLIILRQGKLMEKKFIAGKIS